MHAILTRRSRVLQIGAAMLTIIAFAATARADIYQWEYINPANPSQGKRQSTTLAPGGAGVDAVPDAYLRNRNLTMAYLIGADLRNANVVLTNLNDADISQSNLTDANFGGADLTGASFREANLANAMFAFCEGDAECTQFTATLTDADFTGAEVQGASFDRSAFCFLFCTFQGGITLSQLYSTASYQAHDLSGIGLGSNNLAGGNFAGQNLTNAWFNGATLTDADFSHTNLTNSYFSGATLTDADFTAADARGAQYFDVPGSAITTNLIRPDGHIDGVTLDAGGLIVRDFDGDSRPWRLLPPSPITVQGHVAMGPGGTLRMVFEADAWDSTISFAPGIAVTLGGTLELTFAADVNPASQVGRTLDLFDWTGVTPTGVFTISSPYAWELSNLYTTGEITLTAVPEPAALAIFLLVAAALFVARRKRLSAGLPAAHRSSIAGLLVSLSPLLLVSPFPARADIFQWEYIDPADPSQGKQKSTTLAPGGVGVDAMPDAHLALRNLTMAYLIGADLTGAYGYQANLTNADLSQANLTNAYFYLATLTGANFREANLTNAIFYSATLIDADFTGAEVRGTNFGDIFGNAGTGITLAQVYSMASYQVHDLTGIGLTGSNLAGGNFAGQNLTNADFNVATLTGADFRQANLTHAYFGNASPLTGVNFRDANLTNAYFSGAVLTDADFTDAIVRGANLGDTGITLAQLVSTASYVAHDMSGINLGHNNLSAANFAGQNLTNAYFFGAMLTDADFTDAIVRGANLGNTGITLAQLYSTASYQAHDLSGIGLEGNYLASANFVGQNLADASFYRATLTNADFTGAEVRGASFSEEHVCLYSCNPGFLIGTGITPAQLYTTASYQAHDLSGINFRYNDLAGGNFAGQNLTNADFYYATLTGANFTAADSRGAILYQSDAITIGLIRPDGHIDALDLDAGGLLVVRDYDGDLRYTPALPPIPITVDQHLAMGPGGTLRMVFEADAWDSTISFAPGIPVTLGGTLEITFADDVNLASQVGRTFDLFDWTGVTPSGAFAISNPYAWDLSNLYTTGEVTLMSVPEPGALLLLSFGLVALLSMRRIALRNRALQIATAMFPLVGLAVSARADIFQWEYINPADPSQGKQQSTTLAPDGAGVDAVPGGNMQGRNLTMAYLIGADLTGANGWSANLTNADLSQANLTKAFFFYATLSGADFTDAEVRGAGFIRDMTSGGTGITLAQLYSTASYQAHDLRSIYLHNNYLDGGNFASQNLTNAYFYGATLTGADFTDAEVRGAGFSAGGTGLTTTQLSSTASYRTGDLTGIALSGDLSGWNFAGQNLTGTSFDSATLTGADFTGADVRGANFYARYDSDTSMYVGGITLAQLYSTASYQAYDLSGISLWFHDLTGASFAGQNLSNANFHSTTLTGADFTGALVKGADFGNASSRGFTASQLYSTASYQSHDLSGIGLNYNDLRGWNFAGQNLSNSNFDFTTLTGADFTGAEIQGASFNRRILIGPLTGTGITLGQLYSTASYQAQNLNGTILAFNDLATGNFAGQNLENADFGEANLTGASFREANLANANFSANLCGYGGCGDAYANLTGADFTAADARGAFGFYPLYYSGAITTNLILADGHINGLHVDAGVLLVVRDYDGNPNSFPPNVPTPITVDQHLAMGRGGTLRMVFEADAWDSTISFAPGIPVTLGGTLELTFADDVNLASQVGRTFGLFDWTGVHPTGAFAISSPYAWDLSNLYTTGEVTLTAVPEPSAFLYSSIALCVFFAIGRVRLSSNEVKGENP